MELVSELAALCVKTVSAPGIALIVAEPPLQLRLASFEPHLEGDGAGAGRNRLADVNMGNSQPGLGRVDCFAARGGGIDWGVGAHVGRR